MSLTVDANVFIAAVRQMEVHHVPRLDFLNAVRKQAPDVYCPTLVLPETVAGIARTTGYPALVRQATFLIERLPGMHLVPIDEARARSAADLAALHRLRGADAIYIALAVEFGATVITWDAEMLTRGAGAISVLTPSDWLANPAS